MYAKNDITYELFDIIPNEFYSTLFLDTSPVDVESESIAVKNSISYQKISFLIDTIGKYFKHSDEVKILDVGCGSGTYGARILYHFPNAVLYGIDLSDNCINASKKNKYYDARAHDVLSGLPYDDNSFDFVFSMDFFGHVEFKHKDKIIQEIKRVTKQNGYGFHGIETGFIDYYNCDPKNPEDLIRKYVYHEGHIGVEPLDEIIERFSNEFEVLSAIPFPFAPFLNIENILNSNLWGDEFNKAFNEYDCYNARVVADVIIGYCNKYFTSLFQEVFGDIITEEKVKSLNIPNLEKIVKGFGYSMITIQKQNRL